MDAGRKRKIESKRRLPGAPGQATLGGSSRATGIWLPMFAVAVAVIAAAVVVALAGVV